MGCRRARAIFATGKPAPAMTKAAAVETLKVFAALEPVPAVSMKTFVMAPHRNGAISHASAMPANSSTVSPLTAKQQAPPLPAHRWRQD